jgi:hypothetical protein
VVTWDARRRRAQVVVEPSPVQLVLPIEPHG